MRKRTILGLVQPAPSSWRSPCANVECSLHQLSPYIGKIKSSIAGDLVEQYSKQSDLVIDPFAGAGTIPFEAALRGRRVLAADISPYSRILSLAKLCPPPSLTDAVCAAEQAVAEAHELQVPDLRRVPSWVRRFFHPETLREALRFAEIARRPGNEFLMACFLGILHHQRPGFLSYPSSHLVPYLRDKKYPRTTNPELYSFRELKPRLLAKIRRSYRRFARLCPSRVAFQQSCVQELSFPERFGALITSPPYMNALDYRRDNRLRLWFIDPALARAGEEDVATRRRTFMEAMTSLATNVDSGLRRGGYCVLVVGQELRRSFEAHPSEIVLEVLESKAPTLHLRKVLADDIPDVRRTRRECRGVKTEHFLILQRK